MGLFVHLAHIPGIFRAFGIVLRATRLDTGKVVAVKKIKEKHASWSECAALREVKV